MKKNVKLVVICFLILTQLSCKKEPKNICSAYTPVRTITTRTQSSAGFMDVQFDITSDVTSFKDFAIRQGVTAQNIQSVDMRDYPNTLKIPSTAGFTFADFSSIDLTVDGLTVLT